MVLYEEKALRTTDFITYIATKLHQMTLNQFHDDICKKQFVPLSRIIKANYDKKECYDCKSYLHDYFIGQKYKDVCLLLGEAGTGKTWLSQTLVASLWEKWERGKPIPLWISLLSLDDPHQDILKKHLTQLNELQKETGLSEAFYLSKADIKKFLDSQPSLFIVLDGIDELPYVLRKSNLYKNNHFNDWANHVQVLMTSRKEALPVNDINYISSSNSEIEFIEFYPQTCDMVC